MLKQIPTEKAGGGSPCALSASRYWRLGAAAVLLCTLAAGAYAQGAGAQVSGTAPAADLAGKAPDDVAAAPPGAVATSSGLEMTVLRPGKGLESPVGNDCVVVRFKAWRRDGSIQSTSGANGQTATQCLPRTVPGVAEALKLMSEGEQRRVWVPAKLTYLPTRHGPLGKVDDDDPPPSVDLTFDLELVQIKKVPATPADLVNPPKSATILPSGLAMQVLEAGSGKQHPSSSSRVSMHYSAWTSSGKLFETTVTSGQPGTFQIGSLLPGWREGVLHMVVGEKTRLWLPASLAYGEKPAGRKLPAGSLVLDVKLLAIE